MLLLLLLLLLMLLLLLLLLLLQLLVQLLLQLLLLRSVLLLPLSASCAARGQGGAVGCDAWLGWARRSRETAG